jgi:ribonuclease Y
VVYALVLFAAGLFAALLVARRGRRDVLARVRATAQANLAAARDEANRARAEGELVAREEAIRLERELAAELERGRLELREYETELDERDAILSARETGLGEQELQVQAVERAALELGETASTLAREAEASLARRVGLLEVHSGILAPELQEQLVRERTSKLELELMMHLRERETALEENAAQESRAVMQTVAERYDGEGHLDRAQNAIPLESSRAFSALADPEGRCRAAFLEEVGCDLVLDEAQLAATVRGDDPLARELARRVLRQLASLAELVPDRIRAIARQSRVEVDREVQNAGRKALRELDLGRVHPDVLNLVGRLKFRLSYSQNQWRHSIEVAYLSGMLADELGLDAALARRGGLLHDIGKAMTHDHEGSHALLGADVARRCGEDEVVANAIASHHNDEPARGPIAFVVTAADAMSGGRPGARRESVTQYLNRIHDIQRIAGRAPAVKRVDIMQAGREVRVVVAGAENGAIDPSERHEGPSLTDADLGPLAQDIARRIEEEITYAGQIKVTIIRESRSVSLAH